jgi:hypothetical protein
VVYFAAYTSLGCIDHHFKQEPKHHLTAVAFMNLKTKNGINLIDKAVWQFVVKGRGVTNCLKIEVYYVKCFELVVI